MKKMSSKNVSFNINSLKFIEIKKNTNIFLRSKTLSSNVKVKFGKNINIQECFQIMKKQRSNRGLTDIETLMLLFKNFNSFYSYMNLNNNEEETEKLLAEIAWVIFHKKYKKNSLIKKPGEKKDFFFLLMTGKIKKVSMIFKKEKITLKEYLIYLLKMVLIKEFELLKKCRQLNKSIMDISYNNIEYFCEKNPKYDYNDLLKKAMDDIINLGFDLEKINHHSDEYMDLPSIESYLKVGEIKKDIKSQNKGPSIYLYIPKYELSSTLSKGDYFGFLNKDNSNEYYSYICSEDCDLGFINKNKDIDESFYELIDSTYSNYFYNNRHRFYIFKGIDNKLFNEKYSMILNYQKYKQGDKIFLQGSVNDGVYLIKDGEIRITRYSKLNDLNKLMIKLIWSLKGFQEHVPSSEFKTIIKDNEDKNNTSINDNVVYEDELKLYDFGILKEGDILGLNELYDYKTTLYNFNAECVSREVELIYINKNNFNLILSKENSLYDSVIQKVELRIKYLIGTINSFKKRKMNNNRAKPKKEKSIKLQSNLNIFNTHNLKQFIGKNINHDFIQTSWSKIKENNSSLAKDKVLFSNKNYNNTSQKNNHIKTINNDLLNIREKLFNKDFCTKSLDKKKFDNKRMNNYNNYLGTNIFKFLSQSKSICHDKDLKENRLTKNKTFISLLNKDSNKRKMQPYNFTSPNNNLKMSNDNIFRRNNFLGKYNGKLPLLGKELSKGNGDKNMKCFKSLYHC
jgi:CRP-like cAMP-binding protein